MAIPSRPQASEKRRVACVHCDGPLEVSPKAMSVFCPHCRKRLILEDYRIKSYHAVRELATCGDVIVEKGGRVAALIKAATLTIKGTVQGNVQVRNAVHVAKTGRLQGNITAPRLVIAIGATVSGFCRIGVSDDDRESLKSDGTRTDRTGRVNEGR